MDALIARVDLNEVINQVDLNQVLERVDLNQIVSRVDIEALVRNTDLGAIMVSSSSNLATEVIDMGRGHAVSMDDTLARWASKLRRNHTRRSGAPELPNAEEES
jgi:CBS-domain-containing membrane protein